MQKKYDISIYKILELKLNLLIQYANSSDLYNSKKLVNWFDKNDQKGKFVSNGSKMIQSNG